VKKIIIFILVLCASVSVFAQDSTTARPVKKTTSKADKKAEKRQRIDAIARQEEEGNLSYHKQSVFGVELRTSGYGIFYELGKRKTVRSGNLYLFELTEIKHQKEEKLGGDQFFSNSFVYGKQNNFYQGKLGFGRQYILGQKGNKNGVAITLNAVGGLDLGLLKPYYLDVKDPLHGDRSIKYEDDPALFMSIGSIYGSSGFTKGWNELKVKPGAFLRAALRFDFGRYNESVQAMEIGVSTEAFAEKIPILVNYDHKQFFTQIHIAFVFGGRK
jgi:hypothetical protein